MSAPPRGRIRLTARLTAVVAALGSAAVLSTSPLTTQPTTQSTTQPTHQSKSPTASSAPVPASVVVAPAATARPATRVVREGAMAAGGLLSARSTSSYGYVLGVTGLLGETPAGLHVWVRPGTPHHAILARNAKATVAVWQKLGLKATYKGYGTPRLREGVVTVTEGLAGCTGGHAGMTWHTSMPLPHGTSYMQSARVVICPRLFRYASWQWSATIRHELGHAAGLGHFDGVYRGSTQVMRSVNHAPVWTFKAGDVNGLRYLASNNTRVRRAIPPRGTLELSTLAGATAVSLKGWAMLTWYRDKPVRIVVTDNGMQIASVDTDVYRPDINRLYDPNTNHRHGFTIVVPYANTAKHEFCLTAVSTVQASSTAKLGCATWKPALTVG